MPQAPPELTDRWHDDGHAIDYLKDQGFCFSRGGLIVPPSYASHNHGLQSAIDYLCFEWDYSFDGWQ